jgi:hypothetical protein
MTFLACQHWSLCWQWPWHWQEKLYLGYVKTKQTDSNLKICILLAMGQLQLLSHLQYISPMLLMYLVLCDNENMWMFRTWVWFLASQGLKIFSTAMIFCCLYYSDAREYKQLMVQCHQILFKFGILIKNTCNFNSVVIVYSLPANTQLYYGDETTK